MFPADFLNGLLGGICIGLAATVLLAGAGRILGVSGILSGALRSTKDSLWRYIFLAGLLAGAGMYRALFPNMNLEIAAPVPLIAAAGFLVGFGSHLGSGCTSGHGVCGLARWSVRSWVATLAFMLSGMAAVWVVNFLGGG